MRKFDLSLSSSRSYYFATSRHQLTILSKTDACDGEKWLNMLGTFVKDWFRYESHFFHGRDSLVDIFFFFQAEDGIRDHCVTGVQTCALPILGEHAPALAKKWAWIAQHVPGLDPNADVAETIEQAVQKEAGFLAERLGTILRNIEIGRASCRERV